MFKVLEKSLVSFCLSSRKLSSIFQSWGQTLNVGWLSPSERDCGIVVGWAGEQVARLATGNLTTTGNTSNTGNSVTLSANQTATILINQLLQKSFQEELCHTVRFYYERHIYSENLNMELTCQHIKLKMVFKRH